MSKHDNKTLLRIFAALFLSLGLTASLCACSRKSDAKATRRTLSSEELEEEAVKKNNVRVRKFINEKLGFEIADEFIEEAELLVDAISSGSGGSVSILVKQNKENELLSLLQKNIGKENNIAPNMISADLNNQYAVELRQMSPIKNWELSGVSIYLARNGSFSYLYIFAK